MFTKSNFNVYNFSILLSRQLPLQIKFYHPLHWSLNNIPKFHIILICSFLKNIFIVIFNRADTIEIVLHIVRIMAYNVFEQSNKSMINKLIKIVPLFNICGTPSFLTIDFVLTSNCAFPITSACE